MFVVIVIDYWLRTLWYVECLFVGGLVVWWGDFFLVSFYVTGVLGVVGKIGW